MRINVKLINNSHFINWVLIYNKVFPLNKSCLTPVSTMGSLSSRGLKGRIGLQWSEQHSPSGVIVKNNFSEQQFHIFSIPNLQINNLKLYFSREFSSLPRTPKIVCLQKHDDHLLVLVEKADQFITHWLSEIHCQLSILLKLKDVLSAFNALKNKFGPFLITEKMIKITANDNLLVWYNQRYESNLIQLPLIDEDQQGENEKIMVQNIVEIFRKCHSTGFNINSLVPQTPTFSEFKTKVKARIDQIQFPFGSKTQSQQSINIEQTKILVLSPQKIKHQKFLSGRKTLNQTLETKKSSNKHRKSDNSSQHFVIDSYEAKTSNLTKQRRHISFLLDEAHLSQQKSIIRQFKRKEKPLSSLSQQTSQNYSSSSNVSSRQTKQNNSYQVQRSKFSKSFNLASSPLNNYFQKTDKTKSFKKKEFHFSNASVSQSAKQIRTISLFSSEKKNEQIVSLQQVTQKPMDPSFSLYRGCESFSSKKHFSLKSTTGTLKKTRQFQENIRQLLQQHEIIKQESDQTHKNSNNYSVESIKEETREEMKGSISLSQDFNKLFSMGDSVASGLEDSMREREFEKILFGSHFD